MPIGKGYGRPNPAPKGKPSKPSKMGGKVLSSKKGHFKGNMPKAC